MLNLGWFLSPTHGPHTFRAFASLCSAACSDEANWTAGPVASHAFLVDKLAPDILITSGPKAGKPALTPNPTFRFSSSDPERFECTVDSGLSSVCSSPFVVKGLKNGVHMLRVSQTDNAMNTRTVEHKFSVDAFHAARCAKGKSKKKAVKRAKCRARNAAAKAKWKKKHHLK
jgi:hypothetical protein